MRSLCRRPLPRELVLPLRFIKWYGTSVTLGAKSQETLEDGPQHRTDRHLLVADDKNILVYNVEDAQWQATVKGAAGNTGKIAHVDFGYTPDEVFVLPEFGVKATIWSLPSGRRVEIRDPKILQKAYDYRPATGHLAILTRPNTHDILLVLTPDTYEPIIDIELSTTDAQGLKWSPDGRWLAVWDTASAGSKVLIYTADGQLFKTFLGAKENNAVELGVKSVEWNPLSGSVVIGDFGENVTILSTTFSEITLFKHRSTVSSPEAIVWQEEINAAKDRSYTIARQPTISPTYEPFPLNGMDSSGISALDFNMDGTLLSTKSDTMPSTIWIWSLKTTKLAAVMIHHAPVKSIHWHFSIHDLLLIHCATSEPTVHIWRESWDFPQILRPEANDLGGKLKASWLGTEGDVLRLMLSGTSKCAIGQMTVQGQQIPWQEEHDGNNEISGLGPEDMFDEGNSFDLSPVKLCDGHTQDDLLDKVEDTFQYRNQNRILT
ncbi:MAG: hypothetical protein LQ342_005027 [Letrouitia transgressa]|nr:MAG: hypothetical protein LQ342_005027 [Letrouitia transgressa]